MKLGITWHGDDRGSVLTTREHFGPVQVQRPLYPEGPQCCHVIMLHPPSGIAGGDELDWQVDVASGAHAALTTPGANRWYKANGKKARQTTRLSVAADARLDWLPMENIFFEQADALVHTEIDLHPDARAIGWEISQLGTITRETHWDEGRTRMQMSLRIDGRLVWVEQGTIAATDTIRGRATGLAGFPVHASLWCYGPSAEQSLLDALTDMFPWSDTLRVGMTDLCDQTMGKSLYVVRALGLHSEDVRNLFVDVWRRLRPAVLDVQARPLRIWNT